MVVHVPSHCALFKKDLDTTILSSTVYKLIFSLSRRLQEVSKNPISYVFQTPSPELVFFCLSSKLMMWLLYA